MSIKGPAPAAGVLMLGVLAGCMVREVPLQDASGEDVSIDFDDWETARSRHFVLHTDTGLGGIETTLRRFEDTYEALKATFFEGVEVTSVEALVFGDGTEYDAVAGRGSAGKFLSGLGSTGSLLIVRHSESPEALDKVVAHELAHRFVDAAHPALPNWLDEGLASYLESADVRGDEVRFGAATRRAIHGFQAAGGVSFTALVRVAPARLYGNEAPYYYSAAWALVHFLMNGRGGALRPRLGRLLVAVEAAARQSQSAEAAFADVYPDVTVADLDEAIERLTRSLSRPAVDVVLSMPFQRPADQPIDRRRADSPQVHALVVAAQRRNRRTVEPGVDLAERPRFVRLDAEPSFERLGYFGLGYGRMFRAPFAWELDAGFGPLGYQVGATARGHVAAGQGGNFFVSAGLGPTLAFKSPWLGNEITRVVGARDSGRRLYYLLGLNPEIAAEIRTPSNVLARVSVGATYRLAESFTQLCTDPLPPGGEPRCPPGALDAEIARDGRDLFVRVGLGYTW